MTMQTKQIMKLVKELYGEGAQSVEIRPDGTLIAKFREAPPPAYIPTFVPYQPRPWWGPYWAVTTDATVYGNGNDASTTDNFLGETTLTFSATPSRSDGAAALPAG